MSRCHTLFQAGRISCEAEPRLPILHVCTWRVERRPRALRQRQLLVANAACPEAGVLCGPFIQGVTLKPVALRRVLQR